MKYDLGTKHLEFILDAPFRSSDEQTTVKKGSDLILDFLEERGSDLILDFLEESWKSEL